MVKVAQLFQGFFDDSEFMSKMLKIALPVMIQNFITAFINMIDTVMVGKLGEAEIAAVGIANQYFFFFNMFLIGLCAGCSIFIAQFWGKKDIENIRRILGIGLLSAIVISLAFILLGFINPSKVIALFNKDYAVIDLGGRYLRIALVSYIFIGITLVYNFSLRSIGDATKPMLISVIALICNIFFNYMFIFGNFGAPALGVEGAAIATVIARVVETTILVIYVYVGKGALAASFRELTDVSFGFLAKSYQTIFPVILNDICWGLASLVYVAVYGRMGTQAIAAIQICNTVNNLFMVVIIGLSSAAAVMVGNSIGEGKEWQSNEYARKFSLISIMVGIFLGLVLMAVAPRLLSFFNVSAIVKSNSLIILYMISIIFSIRALGIMYIVGILRGGGDAKWALFIEGFTMWCIGVPLTILGAFVFHLPVYLVYALAMIEEIFKCLMSIMRFKSGKWIKNVTHNMR